MMHKESPPAKNSFLEDLDRLDVRFFSQIKAFKRTAMSVTHSFDLINLIYCLIIVRLFKLLRDMVLYSCALVLAILRIKLGVLSSSLFSSPERGDPG